MKKEFINIAANELRTPIQSVLDLSPMLRVKLKIPNSSICWIVIGLAYHFTDSFQ
jgi:hypothetical protein